MIKKFKKMILLAVVMLLSVLPSALAEDAPVNVMVNNELIAFDQAPVIQDGRTLVPIRAVFEKAGASVEWDQDTRTATMKKDSYSVSIRVGESFITKNNTPVAIDVPSSIVNDRILIPVRAISEAMDFGVTWNSYYRTVLIATDGKPYRSTAQWKTGFKSLNDFGFFVKSSFSDLRFDLNHDNKDESISFNKDNGISLVINGTDFSETIKKSCPSAFAFGIADVVSSDKFTEIIVVDGGEATVTAHFFRYNGFDLFELQVSRPELTGIEFNENLFFDGVENIISDLDGMCFLDNMVCTGIYSLEEDSINRYSLDYKKSVGNSFTKKFDDNMVYYIDYTTAYVADTHVRNNELTSAETIFADDFSHSIKILDTFMDSTNPTNFEFFVEFADGKTAVIWPYSV